MKNPTYEDCKNCIYRIRNLCRGLPIEGFATKEGTKNFFIKRKIKNEFIKKTNDLNLSEIGFGTFRNSIINKNKFYTDLEKSITTFINEGGNVIDTSSAYLNGTSEYAVGKAISKMIYNNIINRNEIIIIDKYSNLDEDVEKSLKYSLKNINLKNIDIYLLHDYERIFLLNGLNNAMKKTKKIFIQFEELVEMKKIKYYGISIGIHWYFSHGKMKSIFPFDLLEKIYKIAYELKENNNHFKFIEFSLNPIVSSPLLKKNQKYQNEQSTLIETAKKLGLNTISVEPFARKNIFDSIYEKYNNYFKNLTSPYQKQLELIRSLKNVDITLFHSLNTIHIKEIMKLKDITHINYEIAQKIFWEISKSISNQKIKYNW